MATYIGMYQRIARAAGLPSASSNFNDGTDNTAMIKELINESNMINGELAPSRPKSYDISLTSGTSVYTLPADFSKMQLVNYTQGSRLIQIYPLPNDQFLTLQSVTSTATMFTYYTIKKVADPSTGDITQTITLFPTPGLTGQLVTIQYLSVATSLNVDPSVTTGSTTNLVATSSFEQIDKYYALERIFASREQNAQAEYWGGKYKEWFEKYKESEDNKLDSVVVKQGIRTQLNPNLYPVLT